MDSFEISKFLNFKEWGSLLKLGLLKGRGEEYMKISHVIRFSALACIAIYTVTWAAESTGATEPAVPVDEVGFVRLFNGKDITGWVGNAKLWTVRDGMLIGRSPGIKHYDFLTTKQTFEDFVLRFQIQLVGSRGNTGVLFRSKRVKNSHEVSGYQADFAPGRHGNLFDEARRRKILAAPKADVVAKHLNRTDWNDYEIRAEGSRIILSINGVKMVDYVEADKTIPRRGLVALQIHKGGPMEVRFRNIRIKEGKTAYPSFAIHVIKPPRPGTEGNTVPSMVWLHDVNGDGHVDLIASHVAWMNKPGFVHPYVAWYPGPDFQGEHIIVDKESFGVNSRVYRFVMFDVDGDGRNDLIGQGYQPHSNFNHWYRCPDDPTQPWRECYDYGCDLKNGHDIRLRDIDGDGRMDLLLMDSWSGKILVKHIPTGEAAQKRWPYHMIVGGDGLTHYMSFYDVNRDGLEDIVIAKEEDGGKGIIWYEHPLRMSQTDTWQRHFVVDANFTKAFARDLDGDGDVDFVGTGEGYSRGDFGWYERTDSGYRFHEFDVQDNNNDIIGGHNCELVDVDGDGDEDLIVGGVDKRDNTQRFRWYEFRWVRGRVLWIEHVLGVTSVSGFKPSHGFYCGEMAYGDMDGDGDQDFAYAGHGGGFLGWFENRTPR